MGHLSRMIALGQLCRISDFEIHYIISLENKYLLDKFDSKYNHKMDRLSFLSFKSILHFCSDIPQFNFVQLNENSGFINSDVRLYKYSDYQLILFLNILYLRMALERVWLILH